MQHLAYNVRYSVMPIIPPTVNRNIIPLGYNVTRL